MGLFSRFRRAAPAPVQLYGKLPLAKDYLRVGASQDAGLALRSWLDGNFSSAAGEPGGRELPRGVRFFVAGHGPGLAGSAWPSSDSGGLRRFPFALFVEGEPRSAFGSGRFAAELESAWRQLERLRDEAASFADGRSFIDRMRGAAVAPEEGPGSTAHVDFELWARALWPSDGRAGLDGTLDALPRRTFEGLRLPLVADLPLVEQVDAWLVVVSALVELPRNRSLTLLFPQEAPALDEPAFLVIWNGALGERLLPWLERPAETTLGPTDLAHREPSLAGANGGVPEGGTALSASMRVPATSARIRRS